MRLDHLLSKEHHEIWAGPHVADAPGARRFDGWAAPVVGVVRVHTTNVVTRRDSGREKDVPDTLLGFETTSPSPLRPDHGKPGVVVTPVWGRPVSGWFGCRSALVVGCGV